MISISYAICVKDEIEEIKQLIPLLLKYKKEQDEIIVVCDNKGPNEVWKWISEESFDLKEVPSGFKYYSMTFNQNFADWKNKLNICCFGDFIFNIDADELPSELLLENIHDIIDSNLDCEAYWLPRENYVNGITQELIQRWGWRQDERGRINYDDPQLRIYKNEPERIFWQNKVHEQLIGYKTIAKLPEEYYLLHKKSVERQIKQNELYSKLI